MTDRPVQGDDADEMRRTRETVARLDKIVGEPTRAAMVWATRRTLIWGGAIRIVPQHEAMPIVEHVDAAGVVRARYRVGEGEIDG